MGQSDTVNKIYFIFSRFHRFMTAYHKTNRESECFDTNLNTSIVDQNCIVILPIWDIILKSLFYIGLFDWNIAKVKIWMR